MSIDHKDSASRAPAPRPPGRQGRGRRRGRPAHDGRGRGRPPACVLVREAAGMPSAIRLESGAPRSWNARGVGMQPTPRNAPAAHRAGAADDPATRAARRPRAGTAGRAPPERPSDQPLPPAPRPAAGAPAISTGRWYGRSPSASTRAQNSGRWPGRFRSCRRSAARSPRIRVQPARLVELRARLVGPALPLAHQRLRQAEARMRLGHRAVGHAQALGDAGLVERMGARGAARRPVLHRLGVEPLDAAAARRSRAGICWLCRSMSRKPSVEPAFSGGRTMRPRSSIHTACGTLMRWYRSASRCSRSIRHGIARRRRLDPRPGGLGLVERDGDHREVVRPRAVSSAIATPAGRAYSRTRTPRRRGRRAAPGSRTGGASGRRGRAARSRAPAASTAPRRAARRLRPAPRCARVVVHHRPADGATSRRGRAGRRRSAARSGLPRQRHAGLAAAQALGLPGPAGGALDVGALDP